MKNRPALNLRKIDTFWCFHLSISKDKEPQRSLTHLLGVIPIGLEVIYPPMRGIASEVAGRVSLTIIINTVRDNSIVTPVTR